MNQVLQQAIDDADIQAAFDLLLASDNNQKSEYKKHALAEFKRIDELSSDWQLDYSTRQEYRKQLDVCVLVLFVTAPLSTIKKLGFWDYPEMYWMLEIHKHFGIEWFQQWVEHALERRPQMFGLMIQYFEKGLCEIPNGDYAVLGMISGFQFYQDEPRSLSELLCLHDYLLDEYIWRIFDVEGEGDQSLAAHDKYTRHTWSDALIELSERGVLSRDRLLDGALQALDKGFAQFRAGWFSRFFTAMKPTIEELDARQDLLRALLNSPITPTVSFALKLLLKLLPKKKLDQAAFLNDIEPVLMLAHKGNVLSVLKAFKNIAKKDPSTQEQIADLCLIALTNELLEVQQAAFDLLTTFTLSDQQCAQIQANIELIKPSLRQQVLALLPIDQNVEQIDESEVEIEINYLISSEPVVPITCVTELVDAFSQAVEGIDDAIELERLLDGAVKFGAELADLDYAKPLKKRCEVLNARYVENWTQRQCVGLAYSLITRTDSFDGNRYHVTSGLYVFLYQRFIDVFEGNYVDSGLLALPEDTRGFITPQTLVNRFEQAGKAIDQCPNEVALAILRLNLDYDCDYAELIARLKLLASDASNALIYALGGEIKVGESENIWTCAARIRHPWKNDDALFDRFANAKPDTALACQYEPIIRYLPAPYNSSYLKIFTQPRLTGMDLHSPLPLLMHVASYDDDYHRGAMTGDSAFVRWCGTIWPSNRDSYFADGAIGCDLSGYDPSPQHIHFFEPLFFADTPFSDMALWLIAVGISAKDIGVIAQASDALVQGIADQRLDLDKFSQILAQMAPSGLVIMDRWVKVFEQISQLSPAYADAVIYLLENLLTFDSAESPRNLANLLQLLNELLIERGQNLRAAPAICFMQTNVKAGKQKQAVKDLLARI